MIPWYKGEGKEMEDTKMTTLFTCTIVCTECLHRAYALVSLPVLAGTKDSKNNTE